MNCRPGDLAVIVGGSKYAGHLVDVLFLAPRADFFLPDGYPHEGCERGDWVIKLKGSPVSVPLPSTGGVRMALYGACADRKLRPIRGLPEPEHVETEATA